MTAGELASADPTVELGFCKLQQPKSEQGSRG